MELPLPVNLPADYVPDKNVRLGLYRRMSNIRSLAELDALAEEFEDRFGPSPEMVKNLFYQLKIRLLAEAAGLTSITVDSEQLVLRYPGEALPTDLLDPGPPVRVGKTAMWMPYKSTPDWPMRLEEILLRLGRELMHFKTV